MGFEHHAFISYAHIDNEPLKDKGSGWIERLHRTLEKMVGQKLGEEVSIWRDKRLRPNEDFAAEIDDNLPRSAVMVSVFTPRYARSSWCKREISTFCELAESNGGLLVDNKARVFRVNKTPPLDNQRDSLLEGMPPVLGKSLGYDFYTYDEKRCGWSELDPDYGEKHEQDFLLMTRSLAEDIAKLLNQMTAVAPASATATSPVAVPAAPAPARPVVYLTECGKFHRANRERIASELKREGYTVVPEHPLPDDETEMVAEVRALLEKASCSVHLIGPLYGVIPEGTSRKSMGIWQNELAAERARAVRAAGGRFERVIWLHVGGSEESPGQQPLIDPDQQTFIDGLLGNRDMQFAADLVKGDIEKFKEAIRAALHKLEQAAATPVASSAPALATDAAPALVYVVCDARDRPNALKLMRALLERGCDPKLPLTRGEAQQLREAHGATLAAADAVVLLHGEGDAVWRRLQEAEIRKAAGQRLDRPLRPLVTCLLGPETEEKSLDVELGKKGVVNAMAGLDDAAIEKLCVALGLPGIAP